MNTKQTVTMQTKQNIMKTRQILPQLQRARLKLPMLMLLALFAMLLGAMTASAGVPVQTTNVVTGSGSPTNYGAQVTFTATITPNTVPAGGIVYFFDNTSTLLGSGVIDATEPRTATYTTSSTQLKAGSHSIMAIYVGVVGEFEASISPAITQIVTPKALTIGASTIRDKTYDGLVTAGAVKEWALSGFVGEETVTATGVAANYTSANVGTNYGVAITYTLHDGKFGGYATNYSLAPGTTNGVVTPKALSVLPPGSTIASRAYNGTNTAGAVTVGTLTNFVGSETVTATGVAADYPSANVGTYPEIVITYTLANGTGGGLAGNYSLANGLADGVITNKALSVLPPTIASKVYDGTATPGAVTVGTLSGFVEPERVTATPVAANYSGTNATSYPGVVITYTLANGSNGGLASNYSLASGTATGVITPKALGATWTTIATKTYDGLATAGAVSVGTLTNTVGSETLTATGVATNYSSAAVGTYNNVVVTYTLVSGTGLAANYSLANGTASGTINTATLTVAGISAQNKVYNGTNTATLNLGSASLVGKVTGDDVTLDTTSALGAFDTKNIGTNKTVTVSGLALLGTSKTNYALTQPTTNANIAAVQLTVAGAVVTTKVYDGTQSAVITNATLSAGVVGTEVVTLATATTGTFDTKNVGTAKSVATAPMTITGADIGNYTLTQPTLTGTITAKPMDITATSDNKTYGQTKVYGAGSGAFTSAGTISPDSVTSVTLACTDGATNTAAAGSYNIIPSAAVGSGLTNYTITYHNGTLTVNQAPLGVLAANASRVYGLTNPLFTVTYFGFVNGETNTVLGGVLTNTCLAVTNSPIGTYPIVPSGLTATNYAITYTNGTLTVQPNALIVTADNKTKYYGQSDPTFTASYSGFVNGDTVTNLGGTLVFTRAPGEATGAYAITPSGLTSTTNYSITFSNGTLTIQKATVLVAANSKSKTYGDTNPALTATVTGTNNSDTINYTLNTTASQFSPVGGYPITVTLGDNNTNYYIVTKTDSTLTVNQKNATVAANANFKSYGTTNPVLTATVTGTTNGDVLNYTLPTTATTTSGVGDYLISVSMGSNPNYNVTVTYNTLTVYKAGLTVQALDASRTYGQTNPVFRASYTGFVNGETNTVLGGTLFFTCFATPDSPIGTYQIIPSGLTSVNYDIHYGVGTLTVQPYALTVTADDKGKAFGQGDPTFTVHYSGFVNGDNTNNLGGTLYFNRTAGGATNDPAGTYPIIAFGLTSTNYAINYSNGTLTIAKAAATVVANPQIKFYGANNPDLTATVTGVAPGDTLNYTLATTATTNSTVGSYPITVTLGLNNTNYFVTSTNSTLTVSPKVATVVANSQSRSYGETNGGLDAAVSGVINGDTLLYTIGTTAQQFSPVGSYPITVTLGVNTNYSVTATNGTVTVGQRAAMVAANEKLKSYGDSNPFLDAIVTGTVNGDLINYSLATTAVQLSTAGSYPITVALGVNNTNYIISSTNSTLTVQAKAATVAANPKSKPYGNANPTLDATVTGTVPGETLNYTLATTATTNSIVGSYPITVSLGSNPNYTVTATNSTLTVDKRVAIVSANPTNKPYGNVNPVLTATVTGAANGETLIYTLATTAVQYSIAGSYPITVTLGTNDNPNYSVTGTNSTLTVNKKDATVLANNKSKLYGAANPALDATVSGMVTGESLNYTLATTATTTSGVGSYPINVTLGLNPNYNVTPTDGSLTIGQAVAAVAANSKFKTYGNGNPEFDATVTGAVNGDTLNYTLATTAVQSSPIGTYPITVTLGLNPNYTVTSTTNTLYVGTRTARVAANPKTKVYGDIVPLLDATVTGVVSGETLNYALTTTATTNSPLGTYPITVTLGINTNYNVTSVDNVLTITRAISDTTVVSSKNPSVLGSNVTFTAMVTVGTHGAILPIGTIQFYTNSLAMGGPVTLSNGVASITVSILPVGHTPVDAIYEPVDDNTLSSLGTVVQTVHSFAGMPAIESVKVNTNGTVTVTFIGTPYGEYVVQGNVGFDPANWVSFSTNTAGSNGKWTIVDSTVGHVSRYYRAVSP